MANTSIQAIQEAMSGILRYGTSTHIPRHLTVMGETILRVAGSQYNSVLVCRSGRVYTMSDGVEGGHKPKKVAGLAAVRVSRAACGDRFTCLVTSEGDLYMIRGAEDPVRETGVPKMRTVSAGAGHYIAIATDGGAWASGLNAHGQLGLGNRVDRLSLTLVSGVGADVREATCANHRSALLCGDGSLYVAGSNAYNALGLGANMGDAETFQRLRLSAPVAAVACGQNHTVALTVEGMVWAWGQNYYGQLGAGTAIEVSCVPVPITGLEGLYVTEISAGGEHTALVTDEGTVLVCGSGGEGELGGKTDVYTPVKFPLTLPLGLKIEQVACVCNATLVLLDGTEGCRSPLPPLQEDLPPPAEITDWERSIMATLECPICFRIMCAPIHQCAKGHNFCHSCHVRSESQRCCLCRELFLGTRNMALETLGESLSLPCPDCLVRMPTTLLEKHALVCPRRTFCCPLLNSCGWTGMPNVFLTHARAKHANATWERFPWELTHSFEDLAPPVLLSAHGRLFVLHRRFDRSSDGFRMVAELFGLPCEEDRSIYELRVEFLSGPDYGRPPGRLVCSREVCPDASDVNAMLFSDNAVVLRRKNFGVYFRRNQVTCTLQIVVRRRRN